jgi:hypothetical protein
MTLMSTTDVPQAATGWLGQLAWTLRDGWTLTRREVGHLRREPGQLAGAVIFPGLMVLLFGYVFGSAIAVPGGGNSREYLMPGLFAMTAIIGLGASALRMSRDVALGVTDRFRSIPMARLAVPFGRTTADLATGVISLVIMAAIALLVGWRARNGLPSAAAAFGLILLLEYAVSWVSVFLAYSSVRRRRTPWSLWCSRSQCSRTRSCPPRACQPGCGRSPTGTPSAHSSRRAASSSATRGPWSPTRAGRLPTPISPSSAGRRSCLWCSSPWRRGAIERRTGESRGQGFEQPTASRGVSETGARGDVRLTEVRSCPESGRLPWPPARRVRRSRKTQILRTLTR